MSSKTQQGPDATGTGDAGALGQTDEQRVAAQRLVDLQRQASEAVSEANEAKLAAAGFKGDLERANVEIAGLRASNERLSEQLKSTVAASASKDGMPTLPTDLPKGGFQLLESVTIASFDETGKAVRTSAKRGDVLLLAPKKGDVEELQAEIGQVARVYAVDKATLEELKALKHLR
jgi:hypothetical protein